MSATVGHDGRQTTETRDPVGDEGVSDGFCCDFGEGSGLWPSCELVHTRK